MKKLSDGSPPDPPPSPPETLTFFTERPLGKRVGLALRDAGFNVVLFTDELPDGAEDPEWIGLCAHRGWIPLTGDLDLLWTPLWRRIICRAKLGVFCLTRNHWMWHEKFAAFLAAMPAIAKTLRDLEPPFLARINKAGEITGVYMFAKEKDEMDRKEDS